MAGKTCLAFLWHFHQPLYVNPLSGQAEMPWVRLHATKGYTDLVATLDAYPDVRWTINVVPSLLDQIESTTMGRIVDPALEATAAPADQLTAEQCRLLLRLAFQVNWAVQVDPVPRFRNLLDKRGAQVPHDIPDVVLSRFSSRDYRDLQVLHTLAWMGFHLRNTDDTVQELRKKGRDFTEEEKAAALAVQRRALTEIVPRLAAAQERGQLELTTSPYFHPILPLLWNTDFAKRALPQAVTCTPPFSAPDDARTQLQMAVDSHTERFGVAPKGLWPSEGSVCPEIVPMISDAGFSWFASDQEILYRSELVSDRTPGVTQPYYVREGDATVTAVFREREISDLIGFSYAANPGNVAAGDLLRRVRALREHAPRTPALAPIILDGENPWEAYPDGGESFLRSLCEQACADRDIAMTTMSEAIEQTGPGPEIGHLYSGSWINANYGIWGDGETEACAWAELRRTREFLAHHLEAHPDTPTRLARDAWMSIYAAEGSDWFWWYGHDFGTENDSGFDALFRRYLQAVFEIVGAPVPQDLYVPIQSGRTGPRMSPPATCITPTIDGHMTHYFEWAGAGMIEADPGQAIHVEAGPVRRLLFGFDADYLYFRLDTSSRPCNADGSPAEACISIEDEQHFRIQFPACSTPNAKVRIEAAREGAEFHSVSEIDTIAFGSTIEVAVPWQTLEAKEGDTFRFVFQLIRDGVVTVRMPRLGAVPIQLPTSAFVAEHWMI